MATILRRRVQAIVIVGTLAFLVFGIYAAEQFVGLFNERALNIQREQGRQAVALARANLEAELFRNTYLSDSLASFVTLDPELTASAWESVAEKLFDKSDTLRNVGIAPGDVITHVYPVAGNEKAIGLDFRAHPEQWLTLQRARELESVYIAGPVELVQGGTALIARFPIFSDYPRNLDYWGSISVVMHFDALVEASGLNQIDSATVALSRENLQSGEWEVFYGEPAALEDFDIQLPVNMPSAEWILTARYTSVPPPGLTATAGVIRAVAFTVTALVLASILLLYRAYRYSRSAALMDELTHIPNRRFVMAQLHRLVSRQARFTVLLIDLNRFKEVNDTLGHEAGDALLVHIAEQLQQATRAADTTARLGGDEFIVILHRVSKKQLATRVVDKIRARVESRPMLWQEQYIQPSISIGYAVCYGQDISVKELLAQADEGMYDAKRKSRKQRQPDHDTPSSPLGLQ